MKIDIIGKPNCPYCDKAKYLLNSRAIPFNYQMIGFGITIDEAKALYPEARTVPIVLINGEWIGGYTELNEYLNRGQETLICG